MKTFHFINAFLICAAVLYSCNKEDQTHNNGEDLQQAREFIISVSCGGEITDVTVSPLTKADASNDLYGIQVYSKVAGGNGSYAPFAYGLFDSLDGVFIKLSEGYQYKFVATLVKEGKDRIQRNSDGGYNYPFVFNLLTAGRPKIQTQFVYDSEIYFREITSGVAICSVEGTIVTYDYPDLDRYYGEQSDFTPSEGGTVTIDMKRTVFGLKVVADGLTEGTLSATINKAPELLITYPNLEAECVLSLKGVRDAWLNEDYKESIRVTFTWTKADGVVVPIATQSFDFYRNKKTTITVKVKENTTDTGLGVNAESDPLGDGGSYNI